MSDNAVSQLSGAARKLYDRWRKLGYTKDQAIEEVRRAQLAHQDTEREALKEWVDNSERARDEALERGMTLAEYEADRLAESLGYRRVVDEHDGAVSVQLPPPKPYINRKLLERPEQEWLRVLGLRRAVRVLDDGRAEKAKALARAGLLTRDELAHLQYLATSDNPIDDVDPATTTPLTAKDAQDALAVLGTPEE